MFQRSTEHESPSYTVTWIDQEGNWNASKSCKRGFNFVFLFICFHFVLTKRVLTSELGRLWNKWLRMYFLAELFRDSKWLPPSHFLWITPMLPWWDLILSSQVFSNKNKRSRTLKNNCLYIRSIMLNTIFCNIQRKNTRLGKCDNSYLMLESNKWPCPYISSKVIHTITAKGKQWSLMSKSNWKQLPNYLKIKQKL